MKNILKKGLLDILACPIDKHYPLELIELKSNNGVVDDGVIRCSKCNRFYPIIEGIPIMLPDVLRKRSEDLEFLKKWVKKLPADVVYNGKPVHLEK